ncbi:MAG TPA: delta-60 repeat domain-containing protein, partial [Phnomibacter sp.]|nr:delta-60 repeat domain-containing protein [Phnomibacter sp.]
MNRVMQRFAAIFFLIAAMVAVIPDRVSAQAGAIDLTFNAQQLDSTNHNFWVNTPGKYGYVQASVVQPDGKVILGGDFETYNGKPVKSLVRLNTDGSLDETFSLADEIDVRTLALQPDGKIIVGGYFSQFAGQSRNRILRLNDDGSLDETFNPGSGAGQAREGAASTIYNIKLLPSGDIIVLGDFLTFNGQNKPNIVRLSATGALDNTFGLDQDTEIDLYNSPVSGGGLCILSNGRIMVGGSFKRNNEVLRNHICRLFANGTYDSTFGLVQSGANAGIREIIELSDGKLLLAGGFTQYNNAVRNRLVRINATGTLDDTFNPGGTGANQLIDKVVLDATGRIYIGGSFTQFNGVNRGGLARLSAAGAVDATFNNQVGNGIDWPNSGVYAIELLSGGNIAIGGYFRRYNTRRLNNFAVITNTGVIVETFNPTWDANGEVRALKALQGGKILALGFNFTHVNRQARNRIAILHADGSLDDDFKPGTGFDSFVFEAVQQPDGKIIVVGFFKNYNGTPRNGIARINLDGSIDAGFDPGTGGDNIYSVALRPDGKILVAGFFTNFNGVEKNRIALLNANGSLDEGFPNSTGANGAVQVIRITPSGKIAIGGTFTQYNGATANRVALLNADGSPDQGFLSGAGIPDGGFIWDILPGENAMYIAGSFQGYNGSFARSITRVLYDGGLDPTFQNGTAGSGPNGQVRALLEQPDGRLILGGSFVTYNALVNRAGIARLNA